MRPNRPICLKTLLPALFALLLPAVAGAQSMTVLGSDSFARSCYTAATFAATMNSASRSELEDCNRALEYGTLSAADRMATLVNRGVVLVALEEYKAAARDYDKALSFDPKTGEVFVNRGNLFYLGEVYDKAVGEYTTALRLGLSKNHVAHYNRGLAYEKMKDFANAEADYRRASELMPDWSLPQQKLDRLARQSRGNS